MTEIKSAKAPATVAKAGVSTQNKTIKDYITIMKPEIEKALPSTITPERFTRITLSAVSNNPKLQACSPSTFLSAMMQSAQLGLEPNTPLGQAYLIPYGNSCQFQLGYKGLLQLAYNSGQIKTIRTETVYENDEFKYELGLHSDLVHVPAMSNRGNPTAYYAVIEYTNGGYGFEVMSHDDVLKHAKKFSKTFNNGPWQSDFESMAKKTVLKQALKYAPLSTELVSKINTDETVKSSISDHMEEVKNDIDLSQIIDAETGEIQEGDNA